MNYKHFGFETGHWRPEGLRSSTGTFDASLARSGRFSLRCDAGQYAEWDYDEFDASPIEIIEDGSAPRTWNTSAWFCVDQLPNVPTTVMWLGGYGVQTLGSWVPSLDRLWNNPILARMDRRATFGVWLPSRVIPGFWDYGTSPSSPYVPFAALLTPELWGFDVDRPRTWIYLVVTPDGKVQLYSGILHEPMAETAAGTVTPGQWFCAHVTGQWDWPQSESSVPRYTRPQLHVTTREVPDATGGSPDDGTNFPYWFDTVDLAASIDPTAGDHIVATSEVDTSGVSYVTGAAYGGGAPTFRTPAWYEYVYNNALEAGGNDKLPLSTAWTYGGFRIGLGQVGNLTPGSTATVWVDDLSMARQVPLELRYPDSLGRPRQRVLYWRPRGAHTLRPTSLVTTSNWTGNAGGSPTAGALANADFPDYAEAGTDGQALRGNGKLVALTEAIQSQVPTSQVLTYLDARFLLGQPQDQPVMPAGLAIAEDAGFIRSHNEAAFDEELRLSEIDAGDPLSWQLFTMELIGWLSDPFYWALQPGGGSWPWYSGIVESPEAGKTRLTLQDDGTITAMQLQVSLPRAYGFDLTVNNTASSSNAIATYAGVVIHTYPAYDAIANPFPQWIIDPPGIPDQRSTFPPTLAITSAPRSNLRSLDELRLAQAFPPGHGGQGWLWLDDAGRPHLLGQFWAPGMPQGVIGGAYWIDLSSYGVADTRNAGSVVLDYPDIDPKYVPARIELGAYGVPELDIFIGPWVVGKYYLGAQYIRFGEDIDPVDPGGGDINVGSTERIGGGIVREFYKQTNAPPHLNLGIGRPRRMRP